MDLDRIQTLQEFAQTLQVSENYLIAHSQGRKAQIPAIRVGRCVRFHPRTVFCKFAYEAGVSPEAIAAGFSKPQTLETNIEREHEPHNPLAKVN